MSNTFLFDANVFVYAYGKEHPQREPCRKVLKLQESGDLNGEAVIILFEEVFAQRRRQLRDGIQALEFAASLWDVFRKVHPMTASTWTEMQSVLRQYPTLDTRDSVYAAVALEHGIKYIVSTDKDFDEIDQITRIDPLDSERIERELVQD